jgi:ABC-type nitrate/sulfonate/bicarbonate transport system substrate-binding protein
VNAFRVEQNSVEGNKMTVRRFIGATLILAAGLLAGGDLAHAQDVKQDGKLTIMVFPGMQNLPLFAAQANGLFAKRGLAVDIKLAPSSDEQRAGLADGRWQVIHAGIDNAVAMVEVAKVDIAIICGGDNSFNHVIVQGDITSFADLRGKALAVDAPDTAYAFQLYEILKRNGLRKGDYTVKPVGATARRLAAMQEDKTLSASMMNPPFSLLAMKSGMRDLGAAATLIGAYQATGGAVLHSWARANPDVLVKYLQAYIEGLRWALDPRNKDATIRLFADNLKLPGEIAAATYAVAADPADGMARDASFDLEGFKNVLKLRADWTGAAPGAADKYLDLSYYQTALAGL